MAAFLITLPVAFQCNLVARLLRLLRPHPGSFDRRLPVLRDLCGQDAVAAPARLPGWALPVLGGLLAAVLVVVWFSSALWYFTSSGLPL